MWLFFRRAWNWKQQEWRFSACQKTLSRKSKEQGGQKAVGSVPVVLCWAEYGLKCSVFLSHSLSTMASFPVLKQEILFRNGTWSYRIPALLYLPRFSIILAFAEEREDVVDEHAKLIVMRRGTYNPATHHVQVPVGKEMEETAQLYCYPAPKGQTDLLNCSLWVMCLPL